MKKFFAAIRAAFMLIVIENRIVLQLTQRHFYLIPAYDLHRAGE